jgi:hypothetical protein
MIDKTGQVLLQLLITLADSALVGIVHLHYLLQDEDEFRVRSKKLYPTPAQNGTGLELEGQKREVCETLLGDHEKGHRGDL